MVDVRAVGLVLGELRLNLGAIASLGGGGIERWIAYPVVRWLVGFGGFLLAEPRREPKVRNPDDT